MQRNRRILSFLLVTVYAFYFVSCNFFYHTHEGVGGRIVHSHLYGGMAHDHTANQISTLSLLNLDVFLEGDVVDAPAPLVSLLLEDYGSFSQKDYILISSQPSLLRAPPFMVCDILNLSITDQNVNHEKNPYTRILSPDVCGRIMCQPQPGPAGS